MMGGVGGFADVDLEGRDGGDEKKAHMREKRERGTKE